LAEQVYHLVGGGRGVSFRELLTLLVLLTRGTREEKVKFIYGVLAVDSGAHIERADMARACADWAGGGPVLPSSLPALFHEGSDRATFEQFCAWLDLHHEQLALASWILSPHSALSLVSTMDTPTFYQTLAGVTHLSEQEIMELEKRFWTLVGNSTSGRIDLGIITPLVSPPLPAQLVPGLFKALDENQDGHVDFKELACGVSAACRGPEMERQKFCFKVFDEDNDGVLNAAEVERMVEAMGEVAGQVVGREAGRPSGPEEPGEELVKRLLGDTGHLGLEDFLVWTVDSALPREFARLLFQLCHVVLGLRASSRREEGEIVRGWLGREEQAGLVPGQVWYLVPMAWWTGWHSYVNWVEGGCGGGGSLSRRKKAAALSSSLASDLSPRVVATGYSPLHSDSSRPATPGTGDARSSPSSPAAARRQAHPSRPGVIDTGCLLQASPHRGITVLTGEGGKLRGAGRLVRGRDYELVPERLWKFLLQVYGGSPALPRQVIRTGQGKVELELNPLSARILKHQTVQRQPAVPSMVGGYSAAALQAGAANTGSYSFQGAAAGPPSVTRRYHAYQAAFSRRTAVGQIAEFLQGRLHVKAEDLRLWLYRGDEVTMKMLDCELTTLEEVGFQDEDSVLAEIRSRDGTWPEEISSLSAGGRAGQAREQPAVPGVTGLNNLGNTCYMNAALQVVSSTRILAEYFKLNCHLYELNRSNPLGMKGHIAKRYGDLVRDMWSGETRTIAPIKLRWTIGKYQAAFSSFQQQDSQELLAFLLDGLHEDLNRVTDKPYVELKDSEGRPDLVVAAEAWENHSLRNKSIIVDLFHGQLKSKVTCKVCGHESVRCDPFFTLSLPLPMERCISLEVVVMLQDGSTPVKYGLSLDMEDKCSAVPPALAKLCHVPPSNLVLVDIVQSQVRLVSGSEQKVRGLGGSCIYAYEVTRTGDRVTNTGGGEGEPGLTITDIQRSVHSSESRWSWHGWMMDDTSGLLKRPFAELKGKASAPEAGPDCDSSVEGAGGKEGRGAAGEVSHTLVGHCMNGLTLCFKVE
jgi:ubiquitin carboxyl-terminal hydrolase 6/32